MKKYIPASILVMLFYYGQSYAQGVQDFFFKNWDISTINPAALTQEGGLRGNLQYNRNAMDGINTEIGGQLQMHSNFGSGHGAGISIQSQKAGIFSGTGLGAGYGYRVKLSDEQSLSVGTRLSYFKQNINRGAVENANVSDPVLYGDAYQQGNLLLSAGALYQCKGLQLAVTTPEFLPMEGNSIIRRNLSAYAGYTFKLNDVALRPNFYYEDIRMLGNWYEMGLYSRIKEQVVLEASYTSRQSMRFRAGFEYKGINLGYGYEAGNASQNNGLSKNSNQLYVEYRFGSLWSK